jgi:sulfate adenylyltransferase (ADP) / ATP adenylyltransferase
MSSPTAPRPPLMRPEDLWPQTVHTTRQALATGALQPISTDCWTLEQHGIPFQVRVLGRAHLKDRPRREQPRAAPFNPFENPEPDLVVGEVSPTHLCLLNKFNVVEHHLLIVTRAFEEQESLLTAGDFEALALCMDGLDGLGFYNSGEVAGASQPHKHLQLIPPLGPEGLRVPMEKVLPGAPGFAHSVRRLGPWVSSPARDGARLLEAYQSLMAELGIGQKLPLPPYNLLATRDWMMLVPRARAESHGINVNAMGFAGSLLVKNLEQLQRLQELGPLELLRQVAL